MYFLSDSGRIQKASASPVNAGLRYAIRDEGVAISGRVFGEAAAARLILPVIRGGVRVETGLLCGRERIFFLTGGFGAEEYRIAPDARGEFRVSIRFDKLN